MYLQVVYMCTCVVHSCLSGMYAYASVRMSQGPGRINPVTGKLGDKRRRVSLRGGVLGGVIKYDNMLPGLVGCLVG